MTPTLVKLIIHVLKDFFIPFIVNFKVAEAKNYFMEQDCIVSDKIEPLPDSFKGFWLANPANIIHLVCE